MDELPTLVRRGIQAARICLRSDHLIRTGTITVVVGTWLTAVNQGDVLLIDGIGLWTGIKIFFNYLTPFIVANLGLISRQE